MALLSTLENLSKSMKYAQADLNGSYVSTLSGQLEYDMKSKLTVLNELGADTSTIDDAMTNTMNDIAVKPMSIYASALSVLDKLIYAVKSDKYIKDINVDVAIDACEVEFEYDNFFTAICKCNITDINIIIAQIEENSAGYTYATRHIISDLQLIKQYLNDIIKIDDSFDIDDNEYTRIVNTIYKQFMLS